MIKTSITTLMLAMGLLSGQALAATINYSTTTTGNRVVTTQNPLSAVSGGIIVLGTFANENDFSTFTEFGRSTIGGNAAFSTGVVSGTTTNNTDSAKDFASKAMYFVIYDNADTAKATYGGIYKSTSVFDSTISSSASQSLTVEVNSFTTAINPSTNWIFDDAVVNLSGTTGTAGNPPVDRTGIVFDLGAVPEPSSALLAASTVLMGMIRRRRK